MTVTPRDTEILAGMSLIAVAWGAARHYQFPLMLILGAFATMTIVLMATVNED